MVKKYTDAPAHPSPPGDGVLYIVATPIGNLGDITRRALDTLESVDRILAEDTRNTRKLLVHFGIKTRLEAVHEHNERQRIGHIRSLLDAGEKIALVSDAGTPLISDPGYHLVNELGLAGYAIVPIPGASALIAALSAAGLATDRFVFEGFLPAKRAARHQALMDNRRQPRTQVYYESSHRIVASIDAMADVFGGQRRVVLAREITKLYEQLFRGTLEELVDWIRADERHQKGEFVVLLAGYDGESGEHAELPDQETLLTILLDELPVKQAAALAAKIAGGKKNDWYRRAVDMKQTMD